MCKKNKNLLETACLCRNQVYIDSFEEIIFLWQKIKKDIC